MKLIPILLLSILSLLAPPAFTQETEVPTTSSPAEASSPDAAESPASNSSTKPQSAESTPAAKAYPTPGVTASSAPSASASPKAAASPVSKSAATSAPIVLKGNAEQQIRQIENAYEAASMAHNAAIVEPFMADDFVLTDSKNRVMNKRAAVAEFKKDTDTYTTAKTAELKLHPVDRGVYVVTGVAHEAGKDKAGKPFDRRYRFTDTFVNRNGKWLVVATHVSTLSSR